MGVLPDWMLDESKAILHRQPGVKRPGVISYGTSSYGYDARIGYKFKVFTPTWCGVVDPKHFDEKAFVEVDVSPYTQHDWDENPYFKADLHCLRCGVAFDNPHRASYDEECFL